MSDVFRYDRLRREHERLEALIREETRRPSPDFLVVQQLKKKKLAVRERLAAHAADGGRAA